MDFISNFSTFWAVFLGAILATIGGFAATQVEWVLERRRRERNAALFFGEVLSTLTIILALADDTRKIGDPYGPVTLRMVRSAHKEVDIYNRNRESLFDLRNAEIRQKIHTLLLRIVMSAEGVFDATNELATTGARLKEPGLSDAERQELEARIEALRETRAGGFDFMMENSVQMQAVIRQLGPVAGQSFDRLDQVVRNM